jgi:hypothetical protein
MGTTAMSGGHLDYIKAQFEQSVALTRPPCRCRRASREVDGAAGEPNTASKLRSSTTSYVSQVYRDRRGNSDFSSRPPGYGIGRQEQKRSNARA